MYTFRVVRVFTATLAAISAAAQAGTIYVSTGGNDGNDGLTWASAKRTVQAAVNVAQSDDRVWVAAGTYMQRLSLRAGIALYGGFIGNETDLSQRDWTTNQTILDGNYGGSVVTVSSGSRVDGFIIRNGKSLYGGGIYCSGSVTITNNIITSNTVGMAPNFVGYGGGIYCSGPAVITRNTISNNSGIATTMIWDPESDYTWIGSDGGGIYCTDSSATIASNTITGNSASGNGAGLYCNGSWMTVTGNVIANNMANSDAAGGGVWCSGSGMTLARNTVTGNTAYFGAGIYCSGSTGTVADNTVMGNTGYDGGGIYCTGSLAITGNTITGNSGTRGGGIHCGYFSHTTVAGNTISGNSVTCANFRQGGGGIYCYDSSSPIIRNNTIMNNTATGAGSLGYGGGIYCDYQSQPIITNNTIAAGNSAPSGGAVFCYYAPASISNTVIAFNSSGIARYNTSGAVLLKYNCIYSNTAYNFSNLADPTGTNGNISLDPRLANVPARDMHIQPGSPCINTGDLAFVPAAGETDTDGQPRKIGPRVDIGADEFCWAGDADFDGSVSITDLQLLVAAWTTERGDSGYSPATDCNNDGATNVGDLQLLIANWEKTLY